MAGKGIRIEGRYLRDGEDISGTPAGGEAVPMCVYPARIITRGLLRAVSV